MLVDAYAEAAPGTRPGLILFVQTFGDLANFNPHVHVLATDGAFLPDATFIPLPAVPERLLAEGFRRAVLSFLVQEQALSQALSSRMLGWRHTHFRASFEAVLGRSAAVALLRRVEFHYTPTHASWLNMAEIEIGILDRQCLGRRLMDRATVNREVIAWQRRRNAQRHGIDWTFTRQDADRKLSRHYVSY